jgi:hypothetical protein
VAIGYIELFDTTVAIYGKTSKRRVSKSFNTVVGMKKAAGEAIEGQRINVGVFVQIYVNYVF